MSVTPSQYDVLRRLLDAAELQHQVTGQNIANVNTPGYRTLEISFDEILDEVRSGKINTSKDSL